MVWTKPSIALLIAVCFAACGCGMVYGPVEEVDAFISAKSALTDKWLEIAKTNKTSAGIEEA